MKAPQQPRAADPPTVLHIRRLPTGWSRRHLADRFMRLDGAEGVAEAFYGGENHRYLTFRAHTQALAACAVVSAALGTVAPPPGRLPAAVHCVNRSVIRDLTVHTRRDAPGEERHDTPSAGAAPPHMDRPSLTEDDVRRLIADAVGGTRQVLHPRPQEPARAPTADAVGGARRPLPRGPPPAQQAPSPGKETQRRPGAGRPLSEVQRSPRLGCPRLRGREPQPKDVPASLAGVSRRLPGRLVTPANQLPGMPAQGPPGPAPGMSQLKACPRTSWARIARRWAISKPSPAPQRPLRPAPRRPLATP